MRISTRGRYAVRVMLDLALYSQEEYVKAAYGGDAGTSSAGTSCSGSVSSAGSASYAGPVSCAGSVSCAGPVTCARKPFCEAADVWKQVAEAVSSVVDHVTIADLVRKHHENASKMDEGER